MKKLKGPELKMSELKVPPFLADLFYDLRDRRLLPLVGLVLVAIVAVPILLGGDSEEAITPSETGIIDILKSGGAESSSLTVVEAKPGLRDYRKRLRGRQPTDPFEQRFTAPVLSGADLPESTSATSGDGSGSGGGETTVTTETTESAEAIVGEPENEPSGGAQSGGRAPSDDGSSSPLDPAKSGGKYLAVGIDVQISHTERQPDGTQAMGDPTTRRRVQPLVSLPGEKTPVVTFSGYNPFTSKVLFTVSRDVTATYGDGVCVAGTEACDLMELERGFPQTFVYGPNDVRYKIRLIDVELIRVKRPG